MQPDPALKWIVVTGASAGSGKALVERLAREGRNVIAAARDPARVSGPNGPGRVEVVRLDFDDPLAVDAAAHDIAQIVGAAGLAGLVNMAGIIIEGPLEAVPTPVLRRRPFQNSKTVPDENSPALWQKPNRIWSNSPLCLWTTPKHD